MMRTTTSPSIKLVLAALVAITLATGCGARVNTPLPDATGASDPAAKSIGALAVTVIDAQSNPVTNATVTVTDAKGKSVHADQQTGPDGKTSFGKLPLGSGYTVSAENNGVTGSQSGLGLDGDQPLLVTIMLVPANGAQGTIGGSVTDANSGEPLAGATVSIVGTQSTVTAGADGSYVLKGVPAGNPTVVAIAGGYRESRAAVVLHGGKLERADFKLFPAGDATRFGHTLVTSARSIVELDKFKNVVWSGKGGSQAHPLANGNFLITGGAGGVAEVTASHQVAWTYNPLLIGRLSNPQGVAKAASGHVFIADTGHNRVIEVTQGRTVAMTLPTHFSHPMSVDRVEAAATTLVADTGNNRVAEVNDQGQIVWSVGDGTTGLLNHPNYAKRLGNGNTLITDTGNSRVMEVNKQMQLVWMYGGKGDKATCFLPSSAVRLANGNTLVADTGNNRVIEVNAKGDVTWELPTDQPLFAERL